MIFTRELGYALEMPSKHIVGTVKHLEKGIRRVKKRAISRRYVQIDAEVYSAI